MQVTPNLIQGELHALSKKHIPTSHRYSTQFYPPKLKIDVVEDEQSYLVYLYRK